MRGPAALLLGAALCSSGCAGLPDGGVLRIVVARDSASFAPQIARVLDLVSVHSCPESLCLNETLKTLPGLAVGKPMVVEEISPLYASTQELGRLQVPAKHEGSSWLGFFHPFGWPVARPAKEQGVDFVAATEIRFVAGLRDPEMRLDRRAYVRARKGGRT